MMKQMARGYPSVVDSGLYPTFHEDLLKQGRLKRDGNAVEKKCKGLKD